MHINKAQNHPFEWEGVETNIVSYESGRYIVTIQPYAGSLNMLS